MPDNFWNIIGGIIFFVIPMLLMLYFRIKKSFNARKPNQLKGKISNSEEDILSAKEKENEILIKISEVEREFIAKLDNKISVLNVLLKKADKAIEELKNYQAVNEVAKPSIPLLNTPKEDLHQKIKQLHTAGLSPNEIASHLKMLVGEVTLILSILKKKQDG